jgi:hypothetical protein
MQILNIEASLSQGNLVAGRKLGLLYFVLATSLFIPQITIILLFASVEWDIQMIFSLVTANIMSLLFFAFLVFAIVKNNEHKKKVLLWLEDAIEVNAYSKNIGENRLGIQPKAVKIQVKFKINNKVYTRESTAKVFGGWEGYLGVYKKYADKEIKILYSQKHDQVLILKT